MHYLAGAASIARRALLAPLIALILTAAYTPPSRANVILFDSPTFLDPLEVSSYYTERLTESDITNLVLTIPPQPPLTELTLIDPKDVFDATIAVYSGTTAIKQNLIYEIDLTGAQVLKQKLAGTIGDFTDYLDLSFMTLQVFVVDSNTGGFDLVTNGQVYYTAINGSANVPEPSTWAMMALGFAGLGYAGYRGSRRRAALAG
jgi:hypothetical protein